MTKDELHAAIMNLPDNAPNLIGNTIIAQAYKLGHRDARHAAAELVMSAPPQPTERSADLEAVQRDAWVSVDERLPARWEDVLVHPRPTNYCCEANYTGNGWEYGEYEHHFGHVNRKCTVTHWMPLPSEPIAAAPQRGDK